MGGAALDFDPARLEPYLRARLPQLEGPISVARIGGGQSNPTYRLRVASGEVVLRKQPAGELLPSAHAVDREHRVMAALGATDVPVPAGPRVAPDAALARLDLEDPEPAELDSLATLHGQPHCIEDRVDGHFGFHLRDVGDFRYLVDDVHLDHA
jgi:hypothetical protein